MEDRNIQTDEIELQNQQSECQPSASQAERQLVVFANRARKYYGTKRKPVVVLDGLDMTVHRGTIYGLLGASGCGKTTLLNCILGQRKLNSGEIWIFGKPPGTKGSGIPGPQVGYMPQEVALYGDFTVRETLTYFGWIAGMSNKRIQERFEMLSRLLHLPKTDQRVHSLSGGEQRRVSLASALLHQPELLIMDEPTTGVDPLLREDIWTHLIHISRTENTTIIITTHYIEEAHQADVVGLMRGGVLLAEDCPQKLLFQHETNTLEEVFLKLSVYQNLEQPKLVQHGTSSNKAFTSECNQSYFKKSTDNATLHNNPNFYTLPDDESTVKGAHYIPFLNRNHMNALIWKNILWWMRNIPTLVFAFAFAIVSATSFCLCIGQEPHDLTIALVNYETNNSLDCNSSLTCNATQLSCTFLEYLKKHSLIWKHYNFEDDAIESVLNGETYASITIRHNFSEALRYRVDNWLKSKPWDIKYSNIDVVRDTSNNYIANYLKLRLYDTFQDFIRDYLESCDLDSKSFSVPIRWETPIYGVQYPTFRDFVMPGALNTTTYLLAMILTSALMLIERKEASLVRTFTMGITGTELLLSHVICEVVVMAIQSLLAIFTTFVIFDVTHKGSIVLIVVLSTLVGFCGMSYGILISCACNSFIAVDLLAIGTFIPTIMLSGMIWPIESMHPFLKPITIIFPLTIPTESMRSIMQRNWNLSNEVVYTSFIYISLWSAIFLSLSIVLLKFKKF